MFSDTRYPFAEEIVTINIICGEIITATKYLNLTKEKSHNFRQHTRLLG